MPKLITQLKYNSMLLSASIIWGLSYVFQYDAAHFIGPFLFNALRYLSAFFLLSSWTICFRLYQKKSLSISSWSKETNCRALLWLGVLLGLFSFFGSFFQQVSLSHTTVSKAGFIIESSVVLIPFISFFIGQKLPVSAILGCIVMLIGLFFLSNNALNLLNYGDFFALLSAIIWAIQTVIIERYASGMNISGLANIQFIICGVLSLTFACLFEVINISGIQVVSLDILYSSILGSIIAFMLQLKAQQHVSATHTGMFLSLAAMFSVLAAWLILNETMTGLSILGCIVMTLGMILSQMKWFGSIYLKQLIR
ncbi:MAG: DMT family transporter [Endozoicomonadaceae bacterium]|nr:DMT family transporter [Endozoicomonadaceae bacterium]